MEAKFSQNDLSFVNCLKDKARLNKEARTVRIDGTLKVKNRVIDVRYIIFLHFLSEKAKINTKIIII